MAETLYAKRTVDAVSVTTDVACLSASPFAVSKSRCKSADSTPMIQMRRRVWHVPQRIIELQSPD